MKTRRSKGRMIRESCRSAKFFFLATWLVLLLAYFTTCRLSDTPYQNEIYALSRSLVTFFSLVGLLRFSPIYFSATSAAWKRGWKTRRHKKQLYHSLFLYTSRHSRLLLLSNSACYYLYKQLCQHNHLFNTHNSSFYSVCLPSSAKW